MADLKSITIHYNGESLDLPEIAEGEDIKKNYICLGVGQPDIFTALYMAVKYSKEDFLQRVTHYKKISPTEFAFYRKKPIL